MPDPLSALLVLPDSEKQDRGLTYTPREIHQQPQTWRQTFLRLLSSQPAIAAAFEACGLAPSPHASVPHVAVTHDPPDVLLAGAGSSDYVGRALSRLLQQKWGCCTRSIPSTELVTGLHTALIPNRPCVLISFSRSGDSSEGVALLHLALDRYPGRIRHIVVTCNANGAMAAIPGVFPVVLDDAVNDRGLAMTSSFTNMLVAGQYLAHAQNPADYEPLLHSLAEMGTSLLPRAADLAAALARHRFRRVCFLGSGALHAVAQESALKVLELNEGRIPTLAESFLGLRHGPMTFLREDTLVCAFLSGEQHRIPWELDLLEEIHTRRLAAQILVVTPRMHPRLQALTSHILDLKAPPAFPDDCRPPLDVIPAQLLALFLAIENGVHLDTPAQGSISRVVSHVTIHPPPPQGR